MPLILVVDDNDTNRQMLQTVLQFYGFSVIQARDGREAVSVAQSSQPDLIMMDLSMPTVDGFQATRQLRQTEAFANTPIVAVSAYDMLQDKEAALAAGCDAFFSKPLRLDGLKERLESLIASRSPRSGAA